MITFSLFSINLKEKPFTSNITQIIMKLINDGIRTGVAIPHIAIITTIKETKRTY